LLQVDDYEVKSIKGERLVFGERIITITQVGP